MTVQIHALYEALTATFKQIFPLGPLVFTLSDVLSVKEPRLHTCGLESV